MNDGKRRGIGATIRTCGAIFWTLALGSACEGEVRPYKPNFAAAGSGATAMAPASTVGAAGAAPNPAVSAAPDDGSESTNINQLQPAPAESAANAPASCADGSSESCGPEQQQGLCKFGIRTCSNGAWGSCVGAVLPAARDCSSSEDNDCDGLPDNRQDDVCRCAPNAKQACDEHPGLDGKGPCHAGEQSCVLGPDNSSSDWGPCTGAVAPSAADSCSVAGDDSTCNGTPNDGCPCVEGQMLACGPQTDNGICQLGTSTCQNGAFTPCQGAVFPARRDCSSPQDNDCDGLADNTIDATCQCIPGQGNGPCSADPTRSRCTAQGTCAACQGDGDCSLVSGGRNLCRAGVCTAPRCGDGIVQAERGETCDDGNTVNGDGCSKNCVAGHAPRGGTSFAASHLCGVLPNGSVKCWGRNNFGQLGTGSIGAADSILPPRTVIAGSAVDVAPFGDSTCAALRDGTVSCWGSGFTATPTVVPGISGVTQLAGGDSAFCGRQTSGRVICWDPGGLAITQSAGLGSVVQIANGDRHRCALEADGALLCSGGNSEGELGRGAIGDRDDTALRSIVFGPVAEVATGYRSTCVRLRTGGVQCLGNGITIGNPTAPSQGDGQPANVLNVGNSVKVVASEQHMCALTVDDAVFCWGRDLNASTDGSATVAPIRITLPRPAIDIGAGSFTSCALLDDSSVYCWGSYTPIAASVTPVRIAL
jgi:cysteine-rich repeat protein